MQVIILAAGRGSRLGAVADDLPKCLLQVGGSPLVEHQLKALAEVGASPVLMVVGYAADLVRDAVRGRAETLLNARYATTNSLASLRLAKDWIRGPVIVMNSDLLVDREALELLVRAGPDHLAYDSTSGHAAEHMKVRIEDGRVRALSKSLPKEGSQGENVGMIYLSEASIRAVFAAADELPSEDFEKAFWVQALGAVAERCPIRAVDIAHVPWVEIDTPYDLDRARREIWPAILDRTTPGTRRRRRKYGWRSLTAAAVVLACLGIAAGSLLRPQRVEVWEQVSTSEGRPVTLIVKGMPQDWRQVGPGERISLAIPGPRKLRVDLRAVIAEGVEGPSPYGVEVFLDEQPLERRMFTARPRPTIPHEGGVVCDRDKIFLTLAPGPNRASLRLVSGDLRALMFRLRVLEEIE